MIKWCIDNLLEVEEVEKKDCNINVCKAWLNLSEGAEHVSWSREKSLLKPSEDQVLSKYHVPSDLQVPSDVQVPSISKIGKKKPSNTVGAEH